MEESQLEKRSKMTLKRRREKKSSTNKEGK